MAQLFEFNEKQDKLMMNVGETQEEEILEWQGVGFIRGLLWLWDGSDLPQKSGRKE